jgi:hypothetical protein
MRIAIHGPVVERTDARALAEQRLRLGLSRYAPCISGVELHVEQDRRARRWCALTVRLSSGPVVFIEDDDPDLTEVLDRACTRAGRSIERSLDLRR